MRESEYRRTRKEIEAEIKTAEAALARVQAKLSGLDLLWEDHFSKSCNHNSEQSILDSQNPPAPAGRFRHGPPPGTQHVPVIDGATDSTQKTLVVNGQAQLMIDEAAGSLSGEFGVKDIEAAIHSRHPDKTVNRTTIAGRLRKLVDDGKLEQTVIGQGRRAGKFRGATAA